MLVGILTVLAAAPAHAGNNTYCVGARGECSAEPIKKKHGKWHFHTFVTDGKHCYECYDEVDNTCETNFLANHNGWSTSGLGRCLAIGMAPKDEGVKFHVIGGREVTRPRPKKPPPKIPLTLKGFFQPRSPGPYAVGDRVEFDVWVENGPERRTFSGGHLVLETYDGKLLEKVPVRVKGGSTKKARVAVEMPAGNVSVRFVPTDPEVRSNERLTGVDSPTNGFVVGSCVHRTRVDGPAAVLLVGETLDVTGTVKAASGKPLPADASFTFVLKLDDGLVARFPGTRDGDTVRATVRAPDIDRAAVPGTLSLVATGANTICTGPSRSVTVSRAPFTVSGAAPDQCWTGQECAATFTVGVGSGPGADRARALLAEPELEVIAKVGPDRVAFDGTPAGGTLTLRTTPAREGRVTFSLELRSKGESVQAEVFSDVAEAITLALPEDLDLGAISGGEVGDTCVPLDFSGSNGAVGARFSVSVVDPCADCEAELVSVADGAVYALPLDELTVGKDQILQVCLRVGRCPTGEAGAEQTLLVQPLEARFAGQEKRVRVRYQVAGKGSFACWGWVLYWVGGALLLLFVWYGFRRPVGFPPGASILVASDSKKLRRAAKMLLEEQPGGRKGWYRSARVHVDPGGAATRRSSQALFTLVPHAGGVGIVASGVLAQNKRTRKMEPVEPLPGDRAIALKRGRDYEVGGRVLKLG